MFWWREIVTKCSRRMYRLINGRSILFQKKNGVSQNVMLGHRENTNFSGVLEDYIGSAWMFWQELGDIVYMVLDYDPAGTIGANWSTEHIIRSSLPWRVVFVYLGERPHRIAKERIEMQHFLSSSGFIDPRNASLSCHMAYAKKVGKNGPSKGDAITWICKKVVHFSYLQ